MFMTPLPVTFSCNSAKCFLLSSSVFASVARPTTISRTVQLQTLQHTQHYVRSGCSVESVARNGLVVVKIVKELYLATRLEVCGNGGADPRVLKLSTSYKR